MEIHNYGVLSPLALHNQAPTTGLHDLNFYVEWYRGHRLMTSFKTMAELNIIYKAMRSKYEADIKLVLCNDSFCFNTLRPRQNGRHFADVIFKCIFLNKNVWISLKISLRFVSKVPIDNIPALVQIMAWRRSGDKPLSEPIRVSLPTHTCVTRPQWVNVNTSTDDKIVTLTASLSNKSQICFTKVISAPVMQRAKMRFIFVIHVTSQFILIWSLSWCDFLIIPIIRWDMWINGEEPAFETKCKPAFTGPAPGILYEIPGMRYTNTT